jgi:glutamate/tyrosine decarboxylase-like PLP-dependent enzyme
VAQDRGSGKIPFCVVANAGTTNTGAVDPLDDLATLCWEEGLWLHVDAAYGGGAIVCDDGRCLLQGLGKADSLAIDPHKWLFQPYEMGAVLVKDVNWLRDTFLVISDYGEDEVLSEEEVNYCDYGLQLTRHFRALKLWMSLKAYGVEVFRKAVAHGIHLAEMAQGELANYPNLELTSPAQLGIVTFRYIEDDLSMPKLNDINRKIVTQCIVDRFAMLSSTKLKGMVVLRLCTINSETTETDIQETIARIVSYGAALRKIE